MPTTFGPSFGVVSSPDCVHRSLRVRHRGIGRHARGGRSWLLYDHGGRRQRLLLRYCTHDRHGHWLRDSCSGGRLRTRDDVGSREAAAQPRERCDTERYCRAWYTTSSCCNNRCNKHRVAFVATLGSRFVDRLTLLAQLQIQRRAAALTERSVGWVGRSQERQCWGADITKIIGSPWRNAGASYFLPGTRVPCHVSWEGPSEP